MQKFARWLSKLQLPTDESRAERRRIPQIAKKFFVIHDTLWYRKSEKQPLRRVVDDPERQPDIFRALQDESGHRGRKRIWRKLAAGYYWTSMYRMPALHARKFHQELHLT